jgi:hypothetical protein
MAAILACLTAAALAPTGATAAAPAWTLSMTPVPANFAPGQTSEYVIVATNVGATSSAGEVVIEATLPKAWEVGTLAINSDPASVADPVCVPDVKTPAVTQTVKCTTSEPVSSGRFLKAQVRVKIPALAPEEKTLKANASVSGGVATEEVTASTFTAVQAEPVPFDFLPGFFSPLTDEDGKAKVLGGSHPYQLTTSFGFPTKNPGDGLTNDGHPRDLYVELPRGMAGFLGASEVLCTEAELTGAGCPDPSQVGLAEVTSLGGEIGNSDVFTSNLYNMVPPPGSAAEFAFNVAGIGVFVHAQVGVRSDSDYGVEAAVRDVIAFGQQPIFNAQTQIWGDPTAAVHDAIRGKCGKPTCPVDPRKTAFLRMPTQCPGTPSLFEVLADTWEEPSPPADLYRTSYESAEPGGAPAILKGCDELDFEPTIKASPTTNLTDSPSGLDFTLHQPQDTDYESLSPADLKDAVVTFPAGMAVNPSQAAGLGACTEAQIGYTTTPAGGAPRFTKTPQSCPPAAKIGTLEATSPSLVRRDAQHKVVEVVEVVEEEDESKAVLEPLKGSVYIAQPFRNPFNSLIAAYLVVEDPKTGIVAKLAGEGELDPTTGQLTTRFTENPQIPVEDIKVHVFGGARGSFITPPTCTPQATTAELTPWSAEPGDPPVSLQSGFTPGATPLGGPCPTTQAGMPNAPKMSAGTLSPAAGKYSPLLFKLSRPDGTQRLAKIEVNLPRGLIAKLAGVGECTEAQIAAARSREAPELGALEQSDPSCPASSQIGTATAATGAGPTPFQAPGRVYLAGPYKGAPLSVVAIAPAVAGPFDLGTVVVRSALYLDPVSAQGRIVSDPLPQILHGVPVDLRSVTVRADRPSFSLNPTSCAEKAFEGTALSALGSPAALFQRFQVGGCKSLPYKPKLSAKLFGPVTRGAHPSLRAVFTAKPGEANTRAISFTFPRSEFLDQSHIGTVCTRVQFAAEQCPARSVYGHVRAFSPLLDHPLEGPVYLRSSVHKLPDVVLALRGPPLQPIAVEAAGRVDSVNGGLRVRFQSIPDAPLSKAVFTAQGAKKGLFQNSTNICRSINRATVKLDAQNGKVHDSKPVMKAQCGGKGGGKGSKGGGSKHR